MSITIDKEFESLIPPLSPDEFQQLEENCVKEGIRDALITWNGILVDGHNRFKIAAKHGLHWDEKRMEFADRDAVIAWICNNQLGRRNLHVLDREALMAKKREALERQATKRNEATRFGGSGNFSTTVGKTRDIIGEELGVSGRQVDKLHEINEKATPQTKQLVREGKLSINQAYNSVHEKRPDPVKQARKEREEFKEKKQESVVSFKDVQINKINQDIIEKDLYQKMLKLIGDIEAFGMLTKKSELQTMLNAQTREERERIRKKCTMCIMILQNISESTWR
jgi:polyhydroxyalkanoate synthesis regulator phasin